MLLGGRELLCGSRARLKHHLLFAQKLHVAQRSSETRSSTAVQVKLNF